jgi:hypothetical protein
VRVRAKKMYATWYSNLGAIALVDDNPKLRIAISIASG